VLFPLLLDIPFDKENGIHSLVGLITDEAVYTNDYGAAFVRPPVKIAIYDTAISDNATNVVRAKAKAIWRAKLSDKETYVVAEHEIHKFILAKVKDTWVRELKDATTFYTKVLAINLLQHLQSTCLGTHTIDALSLQIEMREFHKAADGIPEYINMLEDAQRTVLRIDKGNPITD
jgi:hypothetical protein